MALERAGKRLPVEETAGWRNEEERGRKAAYSYSLCLWHASEEEEGRTDEERKGRKFEKAGQGNVPACEGGDRKIATE